MTDYEERLGQAVNLALGNGPSPATLASSEAWLTSLSTRSVPGSDANWRERAAPSAPPAPVMTTVRRGMSSVIRPAQLGPVVTERSLQYRP